MSPPAQAGVQDHSIRLDSRLRGNDMGAARVYPLIPSEPQGAAVQTIEAVVFDWGGVLIDNPAAALMDYCARTREAPTDEYMQVHNKHGEAFQKGRIPEATFWQRVCGDLGRPLPKTPSLWGQAFRAVYSPRREVFVLAERLAPRATGPPCCPTPRARRWSSSWSCATRCLTPRFSPAPRGRASRRKRSTRLPPGKLHVPVGRCVLIHDKPDFIDGARNAGMEGIVYESLEQVKQDLVALGVQTP